MLIGGILAAVVVVGVLAAAVIRHRWQDDVHSVEHYHRQLHTLEEMRTHPSTESKGNGENGNGEAAYPASAFRVSGSSTVRLTDSGHTIVPPVPPPPVPSPAEPVKFDDEPSDAPDGTPQTNFMSGANDPAMHSINRRPKRLGAPLTAVAVVAVLIVVLVVAGLHSNTPPKHSTSGTATTVTTAPPRSHPHSGTGGASGHNTSGHKVTTTTTTAPPAVSAPTASSPNTATYQVSSASYSLALSATTGECWVSATSDATGAALFTGLLTAGESHTVAATGPVTVIAGAPAAFAATVNDAPVQLPSGWQAPFTLKFVTSGTAGGSAPSTTTTS